MNEKIYCNAHLCRVCQGLTTYFDKALGMMLLYEEERAEYKEYRAQHPGSRMSEVYGTAHLLRLLVKLPLLLNQVRNWLAVESGSKSVARFVSLFSEIFLHLTGYDEC